MKIWIFFSILVGSFALAEGKPFKEQNFFIKEGYISRKTYTHFDDCSLKDEFQDEVYFAAWKLAGETHCRNIADVGCGSGYKLLKYFSDCETTGFEIQPTLAFLQKTYPHRIWGLSDFGQKPIQASFDLVVCSDVIEHIVDPDALLNWISQLDFQYLVISTPDRDRLTCVWTDPIYGAQSQLGPPVNIAHVREWNFREFEKYISQYFDVVTHFHPEKEFYGQIIVAVKKPS